MDYFGPADDYGTIGPTGAGSASDEEWERDKEFQDRRQERRDEFLDNHHPVPKPVQAGVERAAERTVEITVRAYIMVISAPDDSKDAMSWCLSNSIGTVGSQVERAWGGSYFSEWNQFNVNRNADAILIVTDSVKHRASAVASGDLEAIGATAEDIAFGGFSAVFARKVSLQFPRNPSSSRPHVPVPYKPSGLIGVPQSALDRVLARLDGLRIGDKPIVYEIRAFGSRSGSQYRGRGPCPDSDLDLLIDMDTLVYGSRSEDWVRSVLKEIADDFEKETGFPLKIHSPENIHQFENALEGMGPIRIDRD